MSWTRQTGPRHCKLMYSAVWRRPRSIGSVGLASKNCSSTKCVRAHCNAACAFGARSHRLKAIPAAYQLLEKHQGPLFEVRVSPDVWLRKAGELHKANMLAVRQLNRRALDALYNTDVVAVGSLKISALPEHLPNDWHLEMHQIVAGVERETLEGIFTIKSPMRTTPSRSTR